MNPSLSIYLRFVLFFLLPLVANSAPSEINKSKFHHSKSFANIDSVNRYYNNVIAQSAGNVDSSIISNAYKTKSRLFGYHQQIDSALLFSIRALNWSNNDSLKITNLVSTARFYKSLGVLDSSYSFALKTLKVANNANNKKALFQVYTIIGSTNLLAEKYRESIISYKKAIKIYPEVEGIHVGMIHVDLAKCYYQLGMQDSAMYFGKLATNESESYKQLHSFQNTHFDAASLIFSIQLERNNFDEAEKWLEKLSECYIENRCYHIEYLLQKSIFYLKRNQLNRVKEFIDRANFIDQKYEHGEMRKEVVQAYLNFYTKSQNYRDALKYSNELLNIIIEEEKQIEKKQNSVFLVLLDVERIKQEGKLLKLDNSQLKKDIILNKKYNTQLWVSGLFFVLVSILSILFIVFKIKAKNRIDKLYQEIIKKNKIISEALVEKETLLLETNHRIKNNFQLVAMFIDMQKDEFKDRSFARKALEDSKRKILAIAKVHELLVVDKNFKEVGLDEYLKSLLDELNQNLNPNKQDICFTSEIEDVQLSVLQTVRVGLFVQEAVSNSFQHGFKGQAKGAVSVLFSHQENICVLRIIDNGVGFEMSHSKSGMGLVLLELIAKQLKGELDIIQTKGTEIKLSFKKE